MTKMPPKYDKTTLKHPKNSPLFHDIMEGERLFQILSDSITNGLLNPSALKFVTLNEIQNTKQDMFLLFVVTEDFQTIITDERLSTQLKFEHPLIQGDFESLDEYRSRQYRNSLYPDNIEIVDFASHADLAQGKPVRAAGMLTIAEGGVLTEAIIGSENYSPTEATLPVMKKALREFGLMDIDNIKIKITKFDEVPIITYDIFNPPLEKKPITFENSYTTVSDQSTPAADIENYNKNNQNYRKAVMPNDEKPGLKELIAKFEERGTLSRQELMHDFQLSSDQVKHWSSRRNLKLERVNLHDYKLGPGLERHYKIQTPYGEWRRDLQQFYPKTYAPAEVWQADLKERLLRNARSNALLMEPHFQTGNTYHLEFIPVRYKHIVEGKAEYHHLAFDHLRNLSPNQLKLNARIAEGQGNWELAKYYKTFSAPTE